LFFRSLKRISSVDKKMSEKDPKKGKSIFEGIWGSEHDDWVNILGSIYGLLTVLLPLGSWYYPLWLLFGEDKFEWFGKYEIQLPYPWGPIAIGLGFITSFVIYQLIQRSDNFSKKQLWVLHLFVILTFISSFAHFRTD
jgi:hypothetical protein